METSIYHKYGCFKEVKEAGERWKNIPLWTEDLGDGIGKFGFLILKTLNQYQLLTRRGILKSVQSVRPDRWKQDRISYVLKSLRKSGMVIMYEMNQRPEGMQALNVYTLAGKADALLKDKGIEVGRKARGSELIHKTEEALMRLSLNQYHTNLLYILGKNKESSFYYTFTISGKKIPSMVRYRFPDGRRRPFERMTLFAFPAVRNEDEIEGLAQQLIEMHAFLTEHPEYRPALAVIVCENMHHAAWISWKFNKIRQMRPLCTMLYALDIVTIRERMLSMLYTCDADETGMIWSDVTLG